MAPFHGWGSTAPRLEPLRGGSLLFTTKFLGATQAWCLSGQHGNTGQNEVQTRYLVFNLGVSGIVSVSIFDHTTRFNEESKTYAVLKSLWCHSVLPL